MLNGKQAQWQQVAQGRDHHPAREHSTEAMEEAGDSVKV